MKWDPTQYSRFSGLRDRPFHDLLGRVGADAPAWVTDLGCGSGELTAVLAARWPDAAVRGIDSSVDMIGSARALEGAPANLDFSAGSIQDWEPPQGQGPGVLLSNAALQWVPGHQELLRHWSKQLDAGSWIAVQVPGNFGALSHVLMRELAQTPRWSSALAGVLRGEDSVSEPDEYLELLVEAGYDADVWETSYQQVLAGSDPVLDWVRGTALRPVMNALPAGDYQAFEAEYGQLLRTAYPPKSWGTVFPFRRIFLVARKRA
ncbi:trans-aconitate 2-methyltransferase [Arthrobacter caoxuetaonis]|uniref:Trans-aconitate 2-methyltransferase n=1 Tax=Arthrobacter caoxuetaonis TaxID=2886935 RepID=A0A9X1MF09_9MICC|nr:trans-aconitate 2-methyltransferase [Arthrobacter caoxuetaonis]MCC3298869.1 trans-aconitate 2-methyltransferase [Arthrobacter caoxuetaonis]USQ55784.1 trans-aconitate 2-methyltransferase [Arthrobacter caoxuetaonis]